MLWYATACIHLSAFTLSIWQFIALGAIVVLFFRCMSALLNPVDRTEGGIKWVLVAYATAIFSVMTVSIAMNLTLQSIDYIDHREFPGEGVAPPGPFGYQFLLYPEAISVVPNVMFLLNQWLADGLLASSVFDSVNRSSYTSHSCSSTAAILFMP